MNLAFQEMQQSLAAAREAAEAAFRSSKQPTVFFREYGAAVEALLQQVWQPLLGESGLCLLATGGFGRNELFPYSDIDLCIVAREPVSDGLQARISQFVQILWDMKLAPSVKSGSVEELCASTRDDITGDTALMEARFLAGDETLAADLAEKLHAQRDVAAFIEAKLLEMQQRHEKAQGSATLLEPDIKSCPGGLRDIHTMLWIAKAQGLDTHIPSLLKNGILTRTEAGMLNHGYRQLSTIRIHLHLCAKRAQERLIFDVQTQVAESMGWTHESKQRQSEALMHIFYRATKAVKQLNGILLPMLQGRVYSKPQRVSREIDADYVQIGNRIAAKNPDIFMQQPEHIFKIIELLQQTSGIRAIEPQTLRAWWGATRKVNRRFYQNPENRRRFLGFFQHGEGLTHVLRFLNLYGVLGRYLPNWEQIVGLLQHDLFHIYPVDDHILTVVHHMRRFALDAHSHDNPFAASLMQHFERKEILYLAAFFHDIAKGRGGDHAIEGVVDAQRFSADHGLPPEDGELLAWLVQEHLLMSAVAQKEDIQDPDVVQAFCRKVGSHERLTALYLLTVADIRGTNPKLWNSWRASLLESLFHAAGRALAQGNSSRHSLFSRRQQEAADLLSRTGTPEKQQQKLWQALGSAYFVHHQSREVLWHSANLAHDVETPQIRSRILPESDTFQVMIFMPNGPRLFARLCRIFSRHGFDILAARGFITAHNYILDTFIVQIPSQHAPDDYPNIQSALEAELNSFIHGYALEGGGEAKPRISRRSRYIPIEPSIAISHEEDHPGWYTIDITAVNRPFLLADIAEVFFAHEVSLRYAKISTLGDRIEDSFSVYSPALENPKNQLALKQALLVQLQKGN